MIWGEECVKKGHDLAPPLLPTAETVMMESQSQDENNSVLSSSLFDILLLDGNGNEGFVSTSVSFINENDSLVYTHMLPCSSINTNGEIIQECM